MPLSHAPRILNRAFLVPYLLCVCILLFLPPLHLSILPYGAGVRGMPLRTHMRKVHCFFVANAICSILHKRIWLRQGSYLIVVLRCFRGFLKYSPYYFKRDNTCQWQYYKKCAYVKIRPFVYLPLGVHTPAPGAWFLFRVRLPCGSS